MSSKFSRFLNLERSRADRPKPAEQPQLQSGNRFETLAQGGTALQNAAVPDTHLERFRGEAPLALEGVPSEQEQQFPRCGSCESDNGRFAKECVVCGADLTTPQQRAFNEQLWQQRREEQAREREAAAVYSQQKRDQEQQADQARYSHLMEKLRREERGGDLGWMNTEGSTIGMKLLGLIPSTPIRGLVFFLCILVPVVLVRYGRGNVRNTGMIIGFVFLFLFLPGRSRSRRWWL